MKKQIINDILNIISKSSSFVIIAHSKPDGDTIGAELALYSFLSKLKKKVEIFSKYAPSDIYKFLPNSEKIILTDKINKNYDVAIILECNDLERAGNILDTASHIKTTINIDHHQGFKLFGNINWICTDCAATCEQIYELLTARGRKLDENEALSLYIGILTDTGAFQQNNATSKTFTIISKLLKYDINIEDIKNKIYNNFRIETFKFLGEILHSLESHYNGKIISMEIKKDNYKKHSATEDDIEGIIDYGRKIKNVKVCCLFREIPGNSLSKQKNNNNKALVLSKNKNYIKVSFRSDGSVNVNNFANKFNGGGHICASGCTIPGSIATVKKLIINALIKEFKSIEQNRK